MRLSHRKQTLKKIVFLYYTVGFFLEKKVYFSFFPNSISLVSPNLLAVKSPKEFFSEALTIPN